MKLIRLNYLGPRLTKRNVESRRKYIAADWQVNRKTERKKDTYKDATEGQKVQNKLLVILKLEAIANLHTNYHCHILLSHSILLKV